MDKETLLSLVKAMMASDWKRIYALTVVYGYMYQIIFWPMAFWLTTILTLRTDLQWPAPPLLPWEYLLAATANLAVIGSVQMLRDRGTHKEVKDGTATQA